MNKNFNAGLIIAVAALLAGSCDIKYNLNEDDDWDDYSYAITGISSMGNLGELLEEKGMEDMQEDLYDVIEYHSKKVDIIDYDYPSTGPDGKRITLSARMYVLDIQLKLSKKAPYLAIANHASIVEAGQCPTRNIKAEAIFAWLGCPVIMPDYYGFGSSEENPQSYLNSDFAAQGNIDALKAAKAILQDKKVKVGDEYYNVGYSQGGFNAIANLKYVSQHPDCGIKFKYTFAGAGSYDINATWDEYLKDTYPAAAVFLPLTIISANEFEGLGLDYANMIKEPLLSNYKEWILAKKYSFGSIMDRIGSNKVGDILTDGMIDGTAPEAARLRKLFDGYSDVSGWTPSSDSKVLLFHSEEDDVVPLFNSQRLYDNLKAAGASVKLVTGKYGGHTNAEIQFAYAIVDEL